MSYPKIVIAGSVSFSATTLEALLRHGSRVVGVLSLSSEVSGRVSDYSDLSILAQENQLPCLSFRKINDSHVKKQLTQWAPDVLFVVGLSQLVDSEILSVPTLGPIGFHPTWLPKGRGRAPVAWLTHDATAGAATFFEMVDAADAGPIFVQEPFPVYEDDYALDVIERVNEAIRRALDRWLPELNEGQWNPSTQDESKVSMFGRRSPEDGLIDWTQPASMIQRLVRVASRPYPGAYTYVRDRKLRIWRAETEKTLSARGVTGRVILAEDPGFVVQTGNGLLRVTEYEFAEDGAEGQPIAIRAGMLMGYQSDDEIHELKARVLELEAIVADLRPR